MEDVDNIVRTTHGDRGYKDCLCCVCGKVSKCTPDNDFYSTEEHGNRLVCERCFRKYVGEKLKNSNQPSPHIRENEKLVG